MKKSIFFCLAIIFISFSCKNDKQVETGEADEAGIRKLIQSYSEAFTRSDWPSVVKLIHPEVFKYIPRADLEKGLEETFRGDDFEIRVRGMETDSVYPVIQKNSRKYSLVMMNAIAQMIFTDSSETNYTDEVLAKVCEGLKGELGEDLISCTTKSNGVEFVIIERCYVVYLPDRKKWFCVTKDEESARFLDKIIPADVSRKLGF